jgi:hypothetical protein
MSAGLDVARWIIDERRPDGSCPRAAAILLRQRLEATMARRRVALGGPRPYESCAAMLLRDDERLAGQVRQVWVQLTRASHGHFPAGPASREQLAAWAEVIARIEELPAGAPTFR